METGHPGGRHPAGRSYVRAYAGVRRGDDHAFIEQAIVRGGGRVLWASGPGVAPLFVAAEDRQGHVHGLMAYVFHANRRVTRNRPADEHRTQIRYGNVNDVTWRAEQHPVGRDPAGVDTTLVIAAHPEADLLIALDPLLYDPLPLGISIFFKDAEIKAAQRSRWHVWERDNLEGVRRPTPRSAFGVETMLALGPERILDLVRLERQAQSLGLDPPLRFRAAELAGRDLAQGVSRVAADMHDLERQYELPARDILGIITERARLAMAVRGGVAEHHAGRALRGDPLVATADVGHQEGPPDYWVTLNDGRAVTVEVKNASPRPYADGTPKVEVQKTRASREDPLSRLYTPEAFEVLAACMYGPTGRWEFRYRRSDDLERHRDHPERIAPLQRIDESWARTLGEALDG